MHDSKLTRDEALLLLAVMEDDSYEHGNTMPHLGGPWPPYRETAMNQIYLKLLLIVGSPIHSEWVPDAFQGHGNE